MIDVKSKKGTILIILFITIISLLPIIIYPSLFLERGNDLSEQFYPVFYYVKLHFQIDHALPLWNNLWFAGIPILTDPQFSIFYPPNTLFLFLNIDTSFISLFMLHIFLGGVGIYLTSRLAFRFSRLTSLIASAFYIFNPKLAGFIEAGHVGLVFSYGWLPFIALSTIKIATKPSILWSLLLAVSLAGTFFTHTLIFLASVIASILLLIYLLLFSVKKRIKAIIFFIFGSFFTFGLTSISLLPQIEWLNETTRSLLLQQRDTYPRWESIKDFLEVVFIPWINNGLWNIDSEKWIIIGLSSTILSITGFWYLSSRLKIITVLSGLLALLLIANNTSPIFPWLITQDWYALMRVSTRIWPLIVLFLTFLMAFGLESVPKKKKILSLIIVLLVFGEDIGFSWTRFYKPQNQTNFAPTEVYQFLEDDRDRFRVFCLTRCLSQKHVAIHNLELLEGYNTLPQTNYYHQSWQLMGGYWNYYTLAIPPIGFYTFDKLKPDPISLGEYNVKYIISPYELDSSDFKLDKKIEGYYIYLNNQFKSRAYYLNEKVSNPTPITLYTPNHVRVDTSSNFSNRIILAQVYSKGWKAYLDGKKEVRVQQRPDALMLVDIGTNTQFVDFKYQPDSFKLGKIITLLTLVLTTILLFINLKIFRKK